MSKINFTRSPDTQFIYQELKNLPVGETISYEKLTTIVGSKVTGASPSFQSAKRILLNEGIVVTVVWGEGVKRAEDVDKLKAVGKDISSIQRKARKGVRRISAIDNYSKLTPKEQMDHATKSSALHMVAAVTTKSGLTKIERKVSAGTAKDLSIRETAAVFLGK